MVPDAVAERLENVTEDALALLAAALAPRLRAGDFLALHGELGAGKTAFARALIRALMDSPDEEVPSPTFAIVQPYTGQRSALHHYDFYRIADPAEADELGLDDALAAGVVIAEWPERLGGRLPPHRLDISLADGDSATTRHMMLTGQGAWAARLERFTAAQRFIADCGWAGARTSYVNGDASARSYQRLVKDGRSAILMDSPKMPETPPVRDGLPYSRIAHIAEDVRPFVAMAGALREAGISAPEVYAGDFGQGFLLIEDFGDAVFTRLAGQGADMLPLYRLAVDALLALRGVPPPSSMPINGGAHVLPAFDRGALSIETELLTDWFLPAARGADTPPELRESFAALWNAQFDWLLAQAPGWVLRDFHSPNLLLRADGEGLEKLGVLDFQDAMLGHPAYDLAALLQDARLDLAPAIEPELLAYYCDKAAAREPAFDRESFIRAYRLLGAQRNTKILGLFARLARRDGKRIYVKHMPRVARYLASDLTHPALAALKSWYDNALPGDIASLSERF